MYVFLWYKLYSSKLVLSTWRAYVQYTMKSSNLKRRIWKATYGGSNYNAFIINNRHMTSLPIKGCQTFKFNLMYYLPWCWDCSRFSWWDVVVGRIMGVGCINAAWLDRYLRAPLWACFVVGKWTGCPSDIFTNCRRFCFSILEKTFFGRCNCECVGRVRMQSWEEGVQIKIHCRLWEWSLPR